MKFVSKASNLRIILRPGIQSNHLTGTEAIPTLYVQFREGMANVEDEELITRMERHPGMNKDFIKVEEAEIDPYASTRVPVEPAHVLSDIENGRAVSRNNTPVAPAKMPPAVQKMIEDKAKELAMGMLPELLETIAAQAGAKTETQETVDETTDTVVEGDESQDHPEETTTKTAVKKTAKKTTTKKSS